MCIKCERDIIYATKNYTKTDKIDRPRKMIAASRKAKQR